MRLTKLSEFRRIVFAPESAPSERTLRTRIRQIPGGTVQLGRYYVDMDEYVRQTNFRERLEARHKELTASPDLVGLI